MVPPFFISLIILGTLVTIWVTYYNIGMKSLLISVLTGIGAGLLAIAFLAALDAMVITENFFEHKTWEVVGKQEQILAPEEGSLLEGSSVFVSGTSDRDMIYTFFVEGPNGSTQAKSIIDHGAESVFLYEVEKNGTPRYEVYHEVTDCVGPEWTKWISSCVDFGPEQSYNILRWEIYVPEGSVSADMSSNMEQ